MVTRRALLGIGLIAMVSACGDGPFSAENRVPSSPVFDGGHMLGSGGRSEVPGEATAGASTETTAGDSTTTGRGGHMLGSGG